jgi:serine/threonine protein kinase
MGLSFPGYLEVDSGSPFRITKELHSGSFGVTYLAEPLELNLKEFGSQIVVKQFKKSQFGEKEISMFQLEVSLMEYFKHGKNIARIIGYTINPNYSILMKYYSRGNLKTWAKKSQYLSAYRLPFASDIAAGLKHMHSKEVVHNDIKPENILIDANEKNELFCVIADFGISQVVSDRILKVKQFDPVEIRGISLNYAAPERLLAYRNRNQVHQKQIILSWDVYSYAVVLYDLLCRVASKKYTEIRIIPKVADPSSFSGKANSQNNSSKSNK